jgi:hypothetical protein
VVQRQMPAVMEQQQQQPKKEVKKENEVKEWICGERTGQMGERQEKTQRQWLVLPVASVHDSFPHLFLLHPLPRVTRKRAIWSDVSD